MLFKHQVAVPIKNATVLKLVFVLLEKNRQVVFISSSCLQIFLEEVNHLSVNHGAGVAPVD